MKNPWLEHFEKIDNSMLSDDIEERFAKHMKRVISCRDAAISCLRDAMKAKDEIEIREAMEFASRADAMLTTMICTEYAAKKASE